MSTLTWIIAASLLGGILSLLFAAMLALNTRASWLSMLVSYAIGALLGAAFLNTLPEAFELSEDPMQVTVTVLIGFVFFILEKLVLWRHCHIEGVKRSPCIACSNCNSSSALIMGVAE